MNVSPVFNNLDDVILELAIDEAYTLRQNSTLNPDEIQMRPGAVFLVEEHDDLRPIQRNGNNFTVSYQEAGLLENTIDRNMGTGNLISANAARSGERVTAAEIQATRDAGGNRLFVLFSSWSSNRT